MPQDSQGRWNKFGGRLPWGPEAICKNNATFAGTGNAKLGEDYVAAPNIDHTQQRVRDDLKAWMKWLKGSVGFDGWRFDFVKGYSAPLLLHLHHVDQTASSKPQGPDMWGTGCAACEHW